MKWLVGLWVFEEKRREGPQRKLERKLSLQWRKPERERERENSKGKAKFKVI